jgi:hypothetical protein
MTRMTVLFLSLALVALVLGCGSEKKSEQSEGSTEETEATQLAQEPDVIAVQHILIGFEGSLPGKPISRTKEEAEALAAELLSRARAGEDFDSLVKKYTDDSHPGIYHMANFGVAADLSQRVYSRGGMVPAFGNVGFSLKVGEIGMAPFDQQQSPYGWHIIKRIE